MVRVKTTAKAKQEAPQEEASFEARVKAVATDLRHLADVASREGDADMERLVNAFGGLLLGLWLEAHRIADAVEGSNVKVVTNVLRDTL